MSIDSHDLPAVLRRIRTQAAEAAFRVTQHAQQEMAEEEILLDEVIAAILSGQILEDHPEHCREACCLLGG